jgi:hypothetical protein
MKIWTAHSKPRAEPLLVREGFSFGALLFGPLWLAARRAWWPAGAALLLTILILFLSTPPASTVLLVGLMLILGLSGNDLVRWSIGRRGYVESNVVSGQNEDAARFRLLTARPDLTEQAMAAEAAP